MKYLFIFILTFVLSIECVFAGGNNSSVSGDTLKLQLFLGSWRTESGEGIVIEKWSMVSESEYKCKSYSVNGKDTVLLEQVSLRYINDRLNYCPNVLNQNDGKEVYFELKNVTDDGTKFTFENIAHDFPQRIIYHFENDLKLTARIEGTTNGKERFVDYNYMKELSVQDTTIFTAKIIKEQFINKGNRKIEGVYDYFMIINGVRYFIKFKNSNLSPSYIDELLNKSLMYKIVLNYGTWDADDNMSQTRIGKYVNIIGVLK